MDEISNLPKSNDQPSEYDLNILKNVGPRQHAEIKWKKIVALTVLFFALNLSAVDAVFRNVFGFQNEIVLLLEKVFIFFIILIVANYLD